MKHSKLMITLVGIVVAILAAHTTIGQESQYGLIEGDFEKVKKEESQLLISSAIWK